MNLRKSAYFTLVRLRGQKLGHYYQTYLQENTHGIPDSTTQQRLVKLLSHCQEYVPYYKEIINCIGNSFKSNPIEYLNQFPILTKDDIRANYNDLKSSDLATRHWYVNSTGGSTGDSIQFIQDWDYSASAGAISMLFSKLVGKEFGEKEIILWGSIHDIEGTSDSLAARLVTSISNYKFLSVYRLDERVIRTYISTINNFHPKLIVAYAQAIYELASFAEREGIEITPQPAIITSAGTLYPSMREKIERVFHCRVYNRYGSREVGDIACELPDRDGLWVAPWGNFVEVVDDNGCRVPAGVEGNVLVTSLINYAMPLIRYKIGDRGVLMSGTGGEDFCSEQILTSILGRTTDMLVNKHGDLVDGMLFLPLFAYKDWIKKFQVIQKGNDLLIIRFVVWGKEPDKDVLDLIKIRAKNIIAAECEVQIEFVDEIDSSPSGKHRYIISEVPRPSRNNSLAQSNDV